MRYLFLITAACLALPAAAAAQTPQQDAQRAMEAQRRAFEIEQSRRDTQRQVEAYQQRQRTDELERRLDMLDREVRTDDTLRRLETQRAKIGTYVEPAWIPPAAPATPADIADAERRRAAALAASETRLKAIAEQMK